MASRLGRTTIEVIIQQDNAKPHAHHEDPALQDEMVKDSLTIKLANQPSNSPDMNVLDLGFFRNPVPTASTVDGRDRRTDQCDSEGIRTWNPKS